MIPPQYFVTYAQYNEDIVLAALFAGVSKGFYVDAGANHPVRHSVTKYFYDRGWHGINIEPNESHAKLLTRQRPNDINLAVGVGNRSDTQTLRIYHSSDGLAGLSTVSSDMQKNYVDNPKEATQKYTDQTVEIKTLADILKEQKVTTIQFLKLDVEGFEFEALDGMDWRIVPEVICIEANHIVNDWQGILDKAQYKLFIQDGLNNYYVHKDAWHLTDGFAERAAELHNHSLVIDQKKAWSRDVKEVRQRLTQVNALTDQLAQAVDHIRKLEQTTLVNQSYPRRLQRALSGLTVGWWRERRR